MTSEWQVPGPQPNRRPLTVTIASVLFAGVALLLVAQALLALREYFAGMDAYEQTETSPQESFAGLGILFQLALCGAKILFAVAYGLLAGFNITGRAWSRHATLAIAGPWFLFCAAPCGVLSGVPSDGLNPKNAAFEHRLAELLPAWHAPVLHTVEVAIAVLLLVVLVLMVLPISADFYLRPQQLPVYFHPEWNKLPPAP